MPSIARVIGNSLAFLLCIILGVWFLYSNPALSIFFFVAAIDNYEDIYEIVTRKKLIPQYLLPFDILIEIIMLLFGVYVLMLGYLYWGYFETPFGLFLLISGVSIVFSSTKDIVKDIRRLMGVAYGVGVHSLENFEFVKIKKK